MTRRTPVARFWPNVDKSGDCWLWTASVNLGGYGLFWNGERTVSAHRFAYELEHGPIPEGLDLLHTTCDNTRCVRASHMELGTQADNAADMVRKHRQGKYPRRKLTPDDVRLVRVLCDWGCDPRWIGEQVGILWREVFRIKSRTTWKDVA